MRCCLIRFFAALLTLSLGCKPQATGPTVPVNQSNGIQKATDETEADMPNEGDSAEATDGDAAELSLADALKQVNDGSAVLVDVRSDDEWNEMHFAQATHIGIDKITEDAAVACAGLDKEKLVLLH